MCSLLCFSVNVYPLIGGLGDRTNVLEQYKTAGFFTLQQLAINSLDSTNLPLDMGFVLAAPPAIPRRRASRHSGNSQRAQPRYPNEIKPTKK